MRAIDSFNKKELTAAYDRLDDVRGGKLPTISAARITYAKSIDELMSSEKDLRIPLILPQPFRDFANKLTLQGLRQSHPPSKDRAEGPLSIIGHVEEHWPDAPVLWCLDNILNWQMLDRSIDEYVLAQHSPPFSRSFIELGRRFGLSTELMSARTSTLNTLSTC